MSYTELKEKLEQLLSEDLSNRNTLQEARRNLFLSSEGSKVQQQLIEQKQNEISSLNTLVEKKKTIVQLKDDEINVLREKISSLEGQAISAYERFEQERKELFSKIEELSSQSEAGRALESKFTELSVQNEEFAAKIRELIYYIDGQNTELEKLKAELQSKTESIAGAIQPSQLEEKLNEIAGLKSEITSLTEALSSKVDAALLDEKVSEIEVLKAQVSALDQALSNKVDPSLLAEKESETETLKAQLSALSELQSTLVDSKLLDEKNAEIERLQERAGLLAESEQQLKMLVASQNSDVENLTRSNNGLKKQMEDIASGWQHQQEQLLSDNSNLLAELALLKESLIEAAAIQEVSVETVSKEQIAVIEAEKESLGSQLQAATSELAALKENISHTPAPLTSASQEDMDALRTERERLVAELDAVRHELNITSQTREEKIIMLQSEVSNLQNQVIALSDTLNRENDEKTQLNTQLEQLKHFTTEKESQLTEMASDTNDDEFIDKLIFQANRLNDEKHRLEMLYTESEAELTLTRTNLAALTQLVEEQKNSISDLDETGKHVKLAQTLMLQASDKTAAKQAINELVREIDKCIALLSE